MNFRGGGGLYRANLLPPVFSLCANRSLPLVSPRAYMTFSTFLLIVSTIIFQNHKMNKITCWFSCKWKKNPFWYYFLTYVIMFLGVAWRTGGAYGLQHTLLLPRAGQRGRGRRGSDVAWGANRVTTGVCKQKKNPKLADEPAANAILQWWYDLQYMYKNMNVWC